MKVKLEEYPIGTPGRPWDDADKRRWRRSRIRAADRSYETNVWDSALQMATTANCEGFHVATYGTLASEEEGEGASGLRLLAFVPHAFKPRGASTSVTHFYEGECTDAEAEEAQSKPTILITGGTHGYETSGIKAALRFVSSGKAKHYQRHFNVVVVPCVSPWSYECNERWTADAEDPNRSFGPRTDSCPAPLRTEESARLLAFLDGLGVHQSCSAGDAGGSRHPPRWLCHIDLHETTDSDVREFRPAKAARDGLAEYDDHVPDGFYLVGDAGDACGDDATDEDRSGFYNAVLKVVEGATHIAEMEPGGKLSGYPAAARGLLRVPCKELGLCAGGAVPDAPYVATTEVYPDSEGVTEEECIDAQISAICGGLDYLVKRGAASSIPCERS